MTSIRLEPATPQSGFKHSTIELPTLTFFYFKIEILGNQGLYTKIISFMLKKFTKLDL